MERIVQCGCCEQFHRADYTGDCRNDDERFESEEDAAERLGVSCLEVERLEYYQGEVVERYIEIWPDCF